MRIPESIEFNTEFKKALELLENTNKDVFITGKAGTGKSTFLNYFRKTTQKKVVVLAPTGVAAINITGETIHSFFRFKPDITFSKIRKFKEEGKNIYKVIDTIIIDEISMVRADLLDCVDRFLRLNGKNYYLPFGSIQMAFIGDLYQLPPVVTRREKLMFQKHYQSPYFFDAKAFHNFPMEFIEFEKVYRQKDRRFIDLLNKIRTNTITDIELNLINKNIGEKFKNDGNSQYSVYLTTTNKMATRVNEQYLNKLKTKLYSYEAEIRGEFNYKYFPTNYELKLKKKAQIMLLNNDTYGRWVNGTLAKIIDIKNEAKKNYNAIVVKLDDGRTEEILPYKWEIFHFSLNEKTEQIETKVVGHFVQYPLKLAWAVTIHKSQGKTFDRVIIDIGRGTFAHGQMYVALSRCKSLEGISLKKPITKKNIFMDWKIVKFLTGYQYQLSEDSLPLREKIRIIKEAIENNCLLKIVYLKSNNQKSMRVIKPYNVGNKKYLGKPFVGVDSYCSDRKSDRVFRVDRILEMNLVGKNENKKQ